jgi:hypothetical protein
MSYPALPNVRATGQSQPTGGVQASNVGTTANVVDQAAHRDLINRDQINNTYNVYGGGPGQVTLFIVDVALMDSMADKLAELDQRSERLRQLRKLVDVAREVFDELGDEGYDYTNLALVQADRMRNAVRELKASYTSMSESDPAANGRDEMLFRLGSLLTQLELAAQGQPPAPAANLSDQPEIAVLRRVWRWAADSYRDNVPNFRQCLDEVKALFEREFRKVQYLPGVQERLMNDARGSTGMPNAINGSR